MKNRETKSGAIKPRYSHYDPYVIGAPSASDLGLVDTGLSGGLSASSSGSGVFDPTGLINNALNSISNVAVAIWGKGDKYRAQALQYINDEQSRTTKILWAVVAIMIIVAAIILIKKSK